MTRVDPAALTGATLAGILIGATAKRWWPLLERAEGRVSLAVERAHARRFDPLVRDRIRSPR